MSCPGSEDAVGSNLKGNPSDLDDRRRLDLPSDQREDNVTAAGTTDRCAGASSLPVPVMAAPNVLESLQEVIKQGPILREIQRGMTDLCSRVGDFERKRGRSSSCDRNTSDMDIINNKRKLLQSVENESESDADSDIEVSNKETHHIPDTQQPSTSKELDNILSDGELASEDESDYDILKGLKLVFKGTEKSGPVIDKGLADVVNEGLRSVGQSEEVKKLWEKFIRPSNVDNLQVPKVEPIIWRNLSDKGKATDAAVQKAVSKFMPDLTAIVQQLELINKHKKKLKKIPVFKEIKKLSTEAVSALSHAVSASCQQRKDAIKSELDSKFHSLCEPAHPVSATQLFGDNLNAELKELDDSKKVHVSIAKKRGFFNLERKNRYDKKYSSQEDFRRGVLKKSQTFSREKGESTSSKKGLQREMVAEAPITTLYHSQYGFTEDCGRRGRSISSSPIMDNSKLVASLAHLIVDFPIRLPPTSKILYQQKTQKELTHYRN